MPIIRTDLEVQDSEGTDRRVFHGRCDWCHKPFRQKLDWDRNCLLHRESGEFTFFCHDKYALVACDKPTCQAHLKEARATRES